MFIQSWFRPVFIALVAALVVASAFASLAAAADDATVLLSASSRKGKVGDLVTFTATVTNNGTGPISDLRVDFNLPDALNAQAISCPGTEFTVTDCGIGSLEAGGTRTVVMTVQIGERNRVTNGPVTAYFWSGSTLLGTASVPELKIIGSPH